MTGAAARDCSGKAKERVKPELSRETPGNRSTGSYRTDRMLKVFALGAKEASVKWSGGENSGDELESLLEPGLIMYELPRQKHYVTAKVFRIQVQAWDRCNIKVQDCRDLAPVC